MQLKHCRYPTCTTLIPRGQANPYCTKHAHLYKPWKPTIYQHNRKQSYKQYNLTKRDKVANAFYHSRQWVAMSRHMRQQAYFTCTCCGRTRDEKNFLVVDHIIPLKVNWRERLVPSNLWVLCKECHYWKTQLEQQIYGDSVIENLDTSKRWTKSKIQKFILSKEQK